MIEGVREHDKPQPWRIVVQWCVCVQGCIQQRAEELRLCVRVGYRSILKPIEFCGRNHVRYPVASLIVSRNTPAESETMTFRHA